MAITNFQFPGVELHQEFVETTPVGTSQLGVAIIGQPNSITSESDAPTLELGVVTSVSDITTNLGSIAATNPMALACYLALSASQGVPIYYVAIKDTAERQKAMLENKEIQKIFMGMQEIEAFGPNRNVIWNILH